MKAIVIHAHGGPEVLSYEEHEDPTPGPGELLVDVHAAGVNYIDGYQRMGMYSMELPFISGMEGSGVVSGLGPGVTDFAIGDRVAWTSVQGSYAEKIAVPVGRAVRVPDGVDMNTAAQALLQGITAHYLVTSVFEIKPGHTALVHAAAGGVGLLLVQMIKARGGTVIGTVSTEAKEKAARDAGADHVIRYDQDEFMPRVRELTGGLGVNVVYDGVGKDTFEGSLGSLMIRGMMVLYGQSSGAVPPVNPHILMNTGSLLLTRPTLLHFLQTPEEFAWRAGDVMDDLVSGRVKFLLGGTYPLAEAAQAQADLESRKSQGKLLLLP